MELHIFPIADIGGVASELGRDLTQGAQRGGRHRLAIGAHAHHEVLGLDGVNVIIAGPGTVVALLTLGVKTHPAEAAPQIRLVYAVETLFGIDIFDAIPHIERRIVMLDLLGVIERLAISQRPLALTASLDGTGYGHSGFSLTKIARTAPSTSPAISFRRRRFDGHAATWRACDINGDVGRREVPVGTALDRRAPPLIRPCPGGLQWRSPC